ncbi:MAG: hypothetical protein AAGG07_10820 [Planctomycetota bacterium]
MMHHSDELARRVHRFERRARWMRGIETLAWAMSFSFLLTLALVALDGAIVFDASTLVVARVLIPLLIVLAIAAAIIRVQQWRRSAAAITTWAVSHGLDEARAESVWSILPERGLRGAMRARARSLLDDAAGPVQRWPVSGPMWSALACAAAVALATALSWEPVTITASRVWSPGLAPPAWSEPSVELELDKTVAPVGSELILRARTEHDVGFAAPMLVVDGVRALQREVVGEGEARWRFEMPAKRSVVSVVWNGARSRPIVLSPTPDPVLDSWTVRVEGGGSAVFGGDATSVAVEAEDGAAISLHARMAAMPSAVRSSTGEARAVATGFAWSGLAEPGRSVTLVPYGPVVPGAGKPRPLSPPISIVFVPIGDPETPAASTPTVDALLVSPAPERSGTSADEQAARSERTDLKRSAGPSERVGPGADSLERSRSSPVESVDPDRPEPGVVPSRGAVDSGSAAPSSGEVEQAGWRARLVRAYLDELQRSGLSASEESP